MAARKPKNIVNNISDAVGSWLGKPRPGEYTQVTQGKGAVKEILKSLDTGLSGGLGQAALKDAQSGSSTPSALYKTAAVNLAAAAAGVGAAKVAGKTVRTVGKIVGKPAKSSLVGYHATPMSSPSAPHLRTGDPNFHVGTEMAAADRAYIFDKGFTKERKVESPYVIHRYEIKKSAAVNPRMMVDNVTETTGKDFVQDVEKKTIKEIRKYVNEFEDPGSVSYLVPKSSLGGKTVKYSGQTVVPARYPAVRKAPSQSGRVLNNSYITSADVAAKKISDAISKNSDAAAVAAVAALKTKNRGGGKNKR